MPRRKKTSTFRLLVKLAILIVMINGYQKEIYDYFRKQKPIKRFAMKQGISLGTDGLKYRANRAWKGWTK